jgi:hypothetical protein
MRWVVTILIMLAIGTAIIAIFRSFAPNEMPALPEDDEIASMSAEAFAGDGLQALPPFQVPDRYVPVFLATMRPAVAARCAESWDTNRLGAFSITTKSGRKIEVTFGFNGQNPLYFRVDGKCFERGGKYEPVKIDRKSRDNDGVFLAECNAVAYLIGAVSWELKTAEQNDRIRELIEKLERSRGDRPPISR